MRLFYLRFNQQHDSSRIALFSRLSPPKNLFPLIALYFLFSATIFAQDTPPILTPGMASEKSIVKDESQIYRFKAQTNDFVRISVQQKRADIEIELLDSSGTSILEIDNSNSREETERLSFIAETSREFQLKISFVRSLAGSRDESGYVIKLEPLQPVTERDKTQVAAERLYQKANLLRFQSKVESKREAVKVFNEAVPLFLQAQDKPGEAFVYYGLGQLFSLLNDFPASRGNYEKAIQIFRRESLRPALALAIQNQAAVYFIEGNADKATELCLESLKIYQELGDKIGEAQISGNLGSIYNQMAQPRKALEFYQRALPILHDGNDKAGEARILSNIGSVYQDLGEPALALANYENALSIRREIGDKRTEAYTLANMSLIYKDLDNVPKTIELLEAANKIFVERGEKLNEATILNNLSGAYQDLNDLPKARELVEKSLTIVRELKSQSGEAIALNNLGSIEMTSENLSKALENFTQALQIFSTTNNKRQSAQTLVKLGEVNLKLGNREKALEFLNQALPVLREIEDKGWEAAALFLIGETNRQNNELLPAKNFILQALEINRQTGEKSDTAYNLLALARIEKSLRNFPEAQSSIEKAVSLVEEIRTRVSRRDLRAAYFAGHQQFYETYIDLLMERDKAEPNKGFKQSALQVSERARARNLLESLGTNQSQIRSGLSADLFNVRQNLIQKINAKEFQRINAVRQKQPEKGKSFENEIAELIPLLRETEAKIREQSPQFAALTEINPPTLKEIQTSLLDENSVLLEYLLGDEHSYLFTVSKNDFKVYELPARAEIEKPARKFYANLRGRAENVPDETAVKREARLAQADNSLESSSLELSRILLSPVAPDIQNKRLLIVASGVLQYISFAGLQNPSSQTDSNQNSKRNNRELTPNRHFLIETNEIVYLPSASALAMLRKIPVKSSSNLISVLADPVFSENDLRVKASARQKQENQSLAINVPAPEVRTDLGRLRFSRQEAESISGLVPENERFIGLDFQANLATAKGANFDKSKIIHFATHGFVRSDFPELSGIVLSLVNENGEFQDGFLRLQEIYNLDLNSRLVVLSACETALGKDIKGEGLVGLTHGFLTAGSKSVAASLWRVDDKATAELMRRFYTGMLKENLRPAEALRKAQISMIRDKNFTHPFYWAAFTLQGEYR